MSSVESAVFQALPVADADSREFWEGCRRSELLLQSCLGCGQLRFPPSPVCWRCRSWDYAWTQHPGSARLFSWVVVHHPIPPSIAPLVPYVVALVELEPGVKMPTRLVDVDPGELVEGMPLEVAFHDVAEDVTLPLFRPATGSRK
jgi:uncharacterized OB-fold protein